jgi:ATP-dependent exoDNAse (exonuclease V) alpha subunit
LDEVEGDEAQSLLYVALTRALDRLVVLFPKAAAAKVAARVSRVAEELSDAR